jgi:uncharacterized small protein (DUF1192 family)
MDERKKTINTLTERKQECSASIDTLLGTLGERLLVRFAADDQSATTPFLEVTEYQRLLKDIAGAEASIRAVIEDSARLGALEDEIRSLETENSKNSATLAELYAQFGEQILGTTDGNPSLEAFRRSWEPRLESPLAQIADLSARLEEIAAKGAGGIFTRIGNGAKAMLYRSQMTKHQAALRRLYAEAGEQFSLSGREAGEASCTAFDDIKRLRALATENELTLIRQKEERRTITDSWAADGGPVNRRRNLERRIGQLQDDLKRVYLSLGGKAESPASRPGFQSALTAEDGTLLDNVQKIRETVADYDAQIAKLEASLAIDAEHAEIDKMEKAIRELRLRIASSEESIADFEKHIAEANAHIQDLMRI